MRTGTQPSVYVNRLLWNCKDALLLYGALWPTVYEGAQKVVFLDSRGQLGMIRARRYAHHGTFSTGLMRVEINIADGGEGAAWRRLVPKGWGPPRLIPYTGKFTMLPRDLEDPWLALAFAHQALTGHTCLFRYFGSGWRFVVPPESPYEFSQAARAIFDATAIAAGRDRKSRRD